MSRQIVACLCVVTGFLFTVGCSTAERREPVLLPPKVGAHVSFPGVTQAGEETHSLEVRHLSYYERSEKRMVISYYAYVVYVAGPVYGPEILEKVDDPAGIFVRMAPGSTNIVEFYYTAGAHTDMVERWKLLGDTAELQEKKEIEWDQDPRPKE